METLIIIITPLIILALGYITRIILNKFGTSIDTQILALSLIKQAVTRTEEIALSSGYKGPEKLRLALTIIDNLAKQHPETLTYIRGKEEELINKILHSSLTTDELTPKNSAK